MIEGTHDGPHNRPSTLISAVLHGGRRAFGDSFAALAPWLPTCPCDGVFTLNAPDRVGLAGFTATPQKDRQWQLTFLSFWGSGTIGDHGFIVVLSANFWRVPVGPGDVKFDASRMMSADSEGYRRGSNTKHAVLVLSGLVAGTSNIEVPISC